MSLRQMSVDRANRSFLALAAITVMVGSLAAWGGIAGVLEPMIRFQVNAGRELTRTDTVLLLVFGGVLAASVVRGCHAMARQAIDSIRLARRIRALAVPLADELAAEATAVGLNGRVVQAAAAAPFSYAYGVVRPRVVVSSGLLTALSKRELRAVLAHERYHVVNLDPLKLTLVRAIHSALFMLPVLETLHRRYLIDRELSADRCAVAACGRASLAAALHKVAGDPEAIGPGTGAAIVDPASLNARIRQLETSQPPRPETLSLPHLTDSILATVALSAAFLACIRCLGGTATVHQATGTNLTTALLLATVTCTIPFAVIGLLAYLAIAIRARHPLASHR